MTPTQTPAELLELYERLAKAVESDQHPGVDITRSGFAIAITGRYNGGGVGIPDDIATDILEVRIWRVLREWAWLFQWDPDGIAIYDSNKNRIGDFGSLHGAAEGVIDSITREKS